MKKRISIIAVVALALIVLVPGAVLADIYYVNQDGTEDFTDIQSALSTVAGGGLHTIIVRDGTYTGVGNKELDFGGKALTLVSENGPTACIIDCEGVGRGFYFHNGETSASVLDGFTIQNGVAPGTSKYLRRGGGIRCDMSSPTIKNCVINNCSAESYGGGLYCYNCYSCPPFAPTFTNCTFSDNTAETGGGLWIYNSSPTITNCVINGNSAVLNGGGFHVYYLAYPVIANCTITGNSASSGGGIDSVSYGGPVIINSILWGNSATDGPEISVGSGPYPSDITVSYSDVQGGEAGIFLGPGCSSSAPGGCTVDWGAGNIDADPLFSDAAYHLQSCSPAIDAGDPMDDYSNEPAPNGDSINMGAYGNTAEAASASLAVTRYVPDDFATIQGALDGACTGDTIIVRDGTYIGADNKNLDFGGKALTLWSENGPENCIIDCEGVGRGFQFVNGETSASVVDGFSIINGNTADYGGGIYCDGASPTIANCTISGNYTLYNGGGIYCEDNSAPAIRNCIITSNGARWGGAIYCAYSTPAISNCTITANSVTAIGGGVFCSGSTSAPEITNCILWGDTGGEIYVSSGSPVVMYSDVQGGYPGTGNIDADPVFADAAYHLQPCSPAIDAGDPVENLTLDLLASALYIYVDDITNIYTGDIVWITDGVNIESADALYVDSTNTNPGPDISLYSGFANDYLVADGSYIYTWYSDFSSELVPNGGRINMGAYGNTAEAASAGPDTDGDGVCDTSDNCVHDPNPGQEDSDVDGVGDVCDNCIDTANPDQLDSEGATFALKFGSYGTGNGQFDQPEDIATDSAGNMYVLDLNNSLIQKFDSAGNFLLQFGGAGTADGQLQWPYGVAVDSTDRVIVADYYNNRICFFDTDGNFLTKWTGYGTGDGQFIHPFSVAVDSADNVYVLSFQNARVQKFDSAGNFLLKFGSLGTADGQFWRPRSVDVDSTGNIFVADTDNQRVQKFDANGNFLTKWATGVQGVAVGPDDNVYVANGWASIRKFDNDGNFLLEWGSEGSGDGEFNRVREVDVDSQGAIYVCDALNHRIQKFVLGDGVGDACDNCWYALNELQEDSNVNCPSPPYTSDPECGDACEVLDADGDGVDDDLDNCPAIYNPGQDDCNVDGVGDACDVIYPEADDSVCDGVDDNCDGTADDGYVPTGTACGQGVCASTGQVICVGGALQDTCTPGLPSAEICNGLDNDCNGIVDDGGNALCDNGQYCDGAETCGGAAGCQAGVPPITDDGIGCTIDACDEGSDSVTNIPDDSSCDNGLWCDGAEYCDSLSDCQAGTPPTCDDGLDCTADSCNEEADVCDNIPTDLDEDGYDICAGPDFDCDDGNDAVNPGAAEICNGVDDNCDGNEDEGDLDSDCPADGCLGGTYFDHACLPDDGKGCVSTEVVTDVDLDGYDVECDGDCVDDPAADEPGCSEAFTCAAQIHPNAAEVCEDGVDQDCSGLDALCEGCDKDGDGHRMSTFFCSLWLGDDCDDDSPNVYWGADEVCDGIDNDCDDGLGNYDEDPITGIDNRDADYDGVNDCSGADKCLGTILPDEVPTVELKPNHCADVDGDSVLEMNDPELGIVDAISFADSYGCSCEQILDCKPGQNNGETKHGCSPGTMDIWMQQVDWAAECQGLTDYGVLVTQGGAAKAPDEDTDLDGIPDVDDADDDNDGIPDTEDVQPEDSENDGKPDWHKKK